jgi:uncharacterized protein YecE (DUF72 family)
VKFGKVENPEKLDLSLPLDHKDTLRVLQSGNSEQNPSVYIGTPKWAKADLKGFYPKGTKDELTYYSTQFNAIELNAFYYRIFKPSVVDKWYDRSAPDFTFFPKIPQLISQFRRLKNCTDELNDYLVSISHFKDKLGTCFLQMNENFTPKNFDDLASFIEQWPVDVPLSIELRHTDWYNNKVVANQLYKLLETNKISNTITDTAGRRDLMHMRLTTPSCFIRYTGANHSSDFTRLDDWFNRLTEWKNQGIENIYFFVHQTIEKEIPLLTARLARRINEEWGYDLKVPVVA